MEKDIVIGIVKHGNKVVIVKRAKVEKDLLWQFPGGKIEEEETEKAAVVREIKEETNAECKVIRKIGVRTHSVQNRKIIYYEMEYMSGEIKVNDTKEIEEVRWIEIGDIDNYLNNIYDKIREALK